MDTAAGRLVANVESVVRGKTEEIKLVLAALACGGHVLLEDVPGTAKTVLARAIAGSIDGTTFSRIQCTPDLQPSDVTGLSVFNQRDRDFEFRPGPVFANVLLVDEINRAMPKTQSALLEAMAEQQVTIDGVTRVLPDPFLVLATENPIEQEGTFPLPEAQLDRFFLRTALGYPGEDAEVAIVEEQLRTHPLAALRPVVGVEDVNALRAAVQDVYIDPAAAPLVDRARARDARRSTALRSAPPCAAASRSSAPRARGRSLHGRDYVDARGRRACSSCRCSVHRIVFTPSFVATARELGREAAARGLPRAMSRARTAAGCRLWTPAGRRDGATTTFPLIPRRRVLGLPFGGLHSLRRGLGSDVAGSRPYEPGDDVDDDRLVRLCAAVAPRAGATSSSSASTTPTKRRASSCSATGGRRCRSSRPAGRGCGRRRRSVTR